MGIYISDDQGNLKKVAGIGTRGPEGPQGPEGPRGPQGVPGQSKITLWEGEQEISAITKINLNLGTYAVGDLIEIQITDTIYVTNPSIIYYRVPAFSNSANYLVPYNIDVHDWGEWLGLNFSIGFVDASNIGFAPLRGIAINITAEMVDGTNQALTGRIITDGTYKVKKICKII